MSNPKWYPFGSTIACTFVVGVTDHPRRTFTEPSWVKSVVLVNARGNPAKYCLEQLRKGDRVFLQGRFEQSEWKRPGDSLDAKFPIASCMLDRIKMTAPGNAAEMVSYSPMIERILRDWGQHETAEPTAD